MVDTHRIVIDRITDEIVTKPVGELSGAESAILNAALRGPYADEVIARMDRIDREDKDKAIQREVLDAFEDADSWGGGYR